MVKGRSEIVAAELKFLLLQVKCVSHCSVLSISGFQNLSFGRLGR